MEAPNLREISSQGWGEILDSSKASRKGESQGHLYVFIDAKQVINLLTKDEGAKRGLTEMGLEKLIPFTMQKMMQCQQNNVRMNLESHIEEMAGLLSQHHVAKAAPAKAKVIEKVEQRVLAQRAPIPQYSVSMDMLTALENCLAANPRQLIVTRSRDGRDGAFFFSHPDLALPRTVIKFCFDVNTHLLADNLLRNFFVTPQYEALSSHPAIASQVRNGVSEKVHVPLKEQLNNMHPESHEARLEKANVDRIVTGLNTNLAFEVVMSRYVKATAFKDIMASDRSKLFSNPEFLQGLGQMMLVDAFLHNTDRITDYQCNKGNFMIQNGKTIIPIDHDCNISRNNVQLIKDNLSSIVHGDGLNGRLSQLLKGEHPQDEKMLLPVIKQGVEDAAKKLLTLLNTEDDCKKIFNVPIREDHATADPALVQEIIQHLRNIL